MGVSLEIAPTLRAQAHGNEPIVIYAYDNHPIDSRVTPMSDTCTTVCARWGTGGLNTPIIVHVVGDNDA